MIKKILMCSVLAAVVFVAAILAYNSYIDWRNTKKIKVIISQLPNIKRSQIITFSPKPKILRIFSINQLFAYGDDLASEEECEGYAGRMAYAARDAGRAGWYHERGISPPRTADNAIEEMIGDIQATYLSENYDSFLDGGCTRFMK